MVEIDAHEIVALGEELQHAGVGKTVDRGEVREVELRDEIEGLASSVDRPFLPLGDPDRAAEAAAVGADRQRRVGAQLGGGQRVRGEPVPDRGDLGLGQRRAGRVARVIFGLPRRGFGLPCPAALALGEHAANPAAGEKGDNERGAEQPETFGGHASPSTCGMV